MHSNTRLSYFSRKLLIERYLKGERVSHISKHLGISRRCCYKWINRYKKEGEKGLLDRRSGPKVSPKRLSYKKEKKILAARKKYKIGPDRLAIKLGIPSSTVYSVLKRYGKNHLFLKEKKEKPNRYQKDNPGELLHMDVKQIPSLESKGYLFQVSIVDDATRYTKAKILKRRTTKNMTNFLGDFIREFPFKVQAVMTDNGMEFTLRYHYFKNRKTLFEKELVKRGIRHILTRPRSPQTNGKVERFHRTVDDELYKVKNFINERHRERALEKYIKMYNSKRIHLGIEGMTPEQKLNIFLSRKCNQVA